MVFLKMSQKSQENTCVRVSTTNIQLYFKHFCLSFFQEVFLVNGWKEEQKQWKIYACNIIKKKSLAQVFSFEFCGIFKNTFFYRTPPVPVCEGCEKRESFRIMVCFYILYLPFMSIQKGQGGTCQIQRLQIIVELFLVAIHMKMMT